MTEYTKEEVGKHNKIEDGWIVVNGDVLDVTKFSKDHPGGVELLEPYLGGDATQAFYDKETHEHSDSAVELVKKLKIGVLEGSNHTYASH